MKGLRQDANCYRFNRMAPLHIAVSSAQIVNVISQQRLPAIKQIDREEIIPAGNKKPPVFGHGATISKAGPDG